MQSIYHEETLPLTQTALFLELQPCGTLFLMNAFLLHTIWIVLKKCLQLSFHLILVKSFYLISSFLLVAPLLVVAPRTLKGAKSLKKVIFR